MALYIIDYDGGQAGQAPALASVSPGPASINAAGTVQYDATRVSHGTLALKHSPAASNVSFISYGNSSNLNFNSASLATRAYYYFTAMPNGGAYMSFYDNADSWVAGAGINSSGQLFIRDSTTSTLLTGTVTLTVNQWLRLELYATAATSDATITAAIYAGSSRTPLDTVTTATGSTSSMLSSVRIGKNNFTAYATPYWVDDVAINTVATGLIGPVSANTPFRIWNGSNYTTVGARLWNGSGYDSL